MVQGCRGSDGEPFAEDQGHPGPLSGWSVLKGLDLDIAAAFAEQHGSVLPVQLPPKNHISSLVSPRIPTFRPMRGQRELGCHLSVPFATVHVENSSC